MKLTLTLLLLSINIAFALVKAQGDAIVLVHDQPNAVLPITAEFRDEVYEFYNINNENIAIIGIDYMAKLGKYNLVIRSSYRIMDIIPVSIEEGRFVDERLSVNKRWVKFTPEVLRRIKREAARARRIYKKTGPLALFDKYFILPLDKIYRTSYFGTRRIYNNYLSGRHGGIDLRAFYGTPIKAINDGIVELAAHHYLPGKMVIINHGLGIFSSYLHLQKIFVRKGDYVSRGEIIAGAGATGRVTGPHLDLRIKVRGKTIHPYNLINVPLTR